MNFQGNPCPYCGKIFTAEDDIVVCPECGTPHHRECYKEMGFCANAGSHGEDFEWHSAVHAEPHRVQHVPKPETGNGETVVCDMCGQRTPAHEKFCIHCGVALGEQRVPSPEEKFQQERERVFLSTLGDDIGGITAKEALIYVRSNAGYFLPRFAAFNKGVKFDTNFSAFIFSYFYLFYRKMYGLGIIAFIANLILSIPTMLLDFAMLQEQYIEMGMLSQIIWEVPHQETLTVFSVIASVLIWGMRIALMLFFNRLYYAKVVGDVKGARDGLANETEEVITRFFYRKGGTSMLVPILIGLCTLAFSFALAGFIVSSEYFIMPDLTNFIPK